MKNSNGYSINVVTNTVTITKNFAKRANNINSPEYKTLLRLRKDGYSIEQKAICVKASKKTHKGLTIKFMENFISHQDDRDIIMASFNRTKGIYKDHPAYYAKMKQWFIIQFPNYKVENESDKDMTNFIEEKTKKIKISA